MYEYDVNIAIIFRLVDHITIGLILIDLTATATTTMLVSIFTLFLFSFVVNVNVNVKSKTLHFWSPNIFIGEGYINITTTTKIIYKTGRQVKQHHTINSQPFLSTTIVIKVKSVLFFLFIKVYILFIVACNIILMLVSI